MPQLAFATPLSFAARTIGDMGFVSHIPFDASSFDLGSCDMSVIYNNRNSACVKDESPTSPFPPASGGSPWSFVLSPSKSNDARSATSSRKRVRFSAKDNITHSIIHISDYTPEEVEACWTTNQEFQDSRASIRATIKLSMEAGHYLNEIDGYCMRGLESRTREGQQQKASNKLVARVALLDAQYDQWASLQGETDPERLASVYAEHTKHCQVMANMMAVRDEQEMRAEDHEARLRAAADSLASAIEMTDDFTGALCDVDDNVAPESPQKAPPTVSMINKERGFTIQSSLVQYTSKAA